MLSTPTPYTVDSSSIQICAAWFGTLQVWEKKSSSTVALLRHNVPQSLSKDIHYGQLFLRAGEPVFVTAWGPIGDCSANGGGLMYLKDSCGLGAEI